MCDSILDTTLVCSGSIQTKMNQSVQGNFLVQFMMPLGKIVQKRTEFFLFRIFLHSVRIQENTEQKKLHIWTLFRQYAENTSGSFVYKSSHRMCSVRKGAFRKFTGKHLCQSLFLIKLQALEHLFYRAPLGHCFCIQHVRRISRKTTISHASRGKKYQLFGKFCIRTKYV